MLGTILSVISGFFSAVKAFLRFRERQQDREAGAAIAINETRGKQDELSKKGRDARNAAMAVDPDSVLDTDPDVRD